MTSLLFITSLIAASENLSIIGTSDLHGRLSQLPLFAGYVDAIRAERPVVLIDGGDVYQGTLESDLNSGEVAIAAYNKLGYGAVAIGNHEFDYGQKKLKARAAQAMFPFLAANLREDGKPLQWPNVKPSTIIKSKDVAVGIIGITTMVTPTTTAASNFTHMSVVPLKEVVAAEAAKLRKSGAHVIVLAAHAGGRCEHFKDSHDLQSCDPRSEIFELANALDRGTVDVIVAGHVHSGIAHEVNGVAIIEAFSKGESFGRVDLVLEDKKVTAKTIFAPTKLKEGAHAPNAEIAKIVEPALKAAEARRAQKLGAELEEQFVRSYSAESTLGNFVTSAMLKAEPRAKIALTNGGGLRADLPAGTLDYGSLYNALPFDNRLTLVKMTGKALKTVLAKNMAAQNGVLSIAGARVTASCKDKAVDVLLEWKQGAPVKDDEEILLVTNDFLATGGDNFTGATIVEEGPIIRESIAARLKSPERLRARDWFDENSPRLRLPSARPVVCP